jgi:hypothetical protein
VSHVRILYLAYVVLIWLGIVGMAAVGLMGR